MSIKNPKICAMKEPNEHSLKSAVIQYDRSVHLENISPLIKQFYKKLGNVSHYVDFNDVEKDHPKAYQFACSHDLFGFRDKDALMAMVKPIIRMDGNIESQRRWRQGELDVVVKKDLVGSVETAYERYKKIASRKWTMNFGHTNEHYHVYKRLTQNVSPSQFEFECGGFYDKIVYMTGLWSIVNQHSIKKVDSKVIVYAKLISEDEHGLKVFKAKWIRPTNKHPKFVNESGYIFSHNGNNVTAAKNVKAEQRIETVAQKMMTEKYDKTAMTRINDLAGRPVPYYLYPIIEDYINEELYSGASVMDIISHFKFTVFITSVINDIKVTKETAEAETAKSVKESIEAAGLTDLMSSIALTNHCRVALRYG